MFVQGGYKGLVIEAQVDGEDDTAQTTQLLAKLFTQYGLTFNPKFVGSSDIETAKVYINALTN